MRLKKTDRGFKRGDFRDTYGVLCSLQESSLATQAAIWLGVDGMRMHLNRDMAKELIRRLQKFVDTGRL